MSKAVRVLLLAKTTGYQTRAFGEAAERLGLGLVFATDRCDRIDDPWRDGAIPIRFHEEDRSVAAIVGAARTHPVDGLVAVGDQPTVIAARVARALGLPWHSPEAAAAARNKLCTRERFRAARLKVPRLTVANVTSDPCQLAASVPFPCVVKPLALSGSRGVIRADDASSFVAAFERLRALLRSPDIQAERDQAHSSVLIEEFVPGREYAVDGLLHHGTLQTLAIFDKPDPLDGPFFEETIYITPSSARAELQEAIVDRVRQAVRALGLYHGPIHAECRVNGLSDGEGVFVLEVAARPIGGLCARALTVNGRPFEEMLLLHALGEDPSGWQRDPDASGVMMIPIPKRGVLREVGGIAAAQATSCVTGVQITAKVDQLLVPLPEGSSYLGFIFARSTDSADVEGALRAAHAQLAFRIDPEFTMLRCSETQANTSQIHYNHSHD